MNSFDDCVTVKADDKHDFHLVCRGSEVYVPYLDASLDLLWCIYDIWMCCWVSCIYSKYRTASCLAEAVQESEDLIQIARENGAEMKKPERLPFQEDVKLLEHRACARQLGCQIQ